MNQNILIIDAHPVYINKIEGFLRGLTFKNIFLAPSAKEGIEKAKELKPHLVILSSSLPDMGSIDISRLIKEGSLFTKIIIQTGLFVDKSLFENFIGKGIDKVLERKEKDLKPLENAINELIVT